VYKWPIDLPPTEFEGLTVESICVSVNTLTINFDNEHSITLESRCQLTVGEMQENIDVPLNNVNFLHILGKLVTTSSVDKDGASLILEFDGISLKIDGNNKDYECFHISIQGNDFVV
jgi:hypothetical protein